MKFKTKILSITLIMVTTLVCVACYFCAINRDRATQPIYAESIHFTDGAGGFELLMDNELILDDSLLTISPSNCSFAPEYSISKYGDKSSTNIEHTESRYKFNSVGKYIIKCKIKSGKYESSYTSTTTTINVVAEPTNSTNMYIKPTSKKSISLGDRIALSDLVNIVYPQQAELNIITSKNLDMVNGEISALTEGSASITIYLRLFNIFLCYNLNVEILPKAELTEQDIQFTLGNNVYYNGDEVCLTSSNIYSLSYELLNCSNQQTTCIANNQNLSILSQESPIILIKPIHFGKTTLYLTPIESPNTTFKIHFVIKD